MPEEEPAHKEFEVPPERFTPLGRASWTTISALAALRRKSGRWSHKEAEMLEISAYASTMMAECALGVIDMLLKAPITSPKYAEAVRAASSLLKEAHRESKVIPK